MTQQPLILGIGGTMRPDSSTERALHVALAEAAQAGARTVAVTARELDLPMYVPGCTRGNEASTRLVELLRACDGLLIASPSYHGGISGLVKNALDYVEELRQDERPYLEGRAVGCIVCVAGWQAVGTTLSAARSIVHALRGWPTPISVGINTSELPPGSSIAAAAPKVASQLREMARQVVEFAQMRAAIRGQIHQSAAAVA